VNNHPEVTTMQLIDKRIIVTGAASGMGAATVEACAAQGARVALLDLDAAGAQDVIARCGVADRVHYHCCDVAQAESVQSAFAEACAQMGGLDVLIHCAGIAPGASAETITLDDWEKVFAVNSRGTFLTNQAAFEHLKAAGGRIINFASAAGAQGYPGKAHYAASKGAVLAWTRTIAREWGCYGITANAIAPAIATPMYAKTRSSMTAEQLVAHDAVMAQMIPLGGKLGDPQRDLAPVMVFLCGDGARFITGQTLAIDGGAMMLS
jgi:NAD(P)-dependent dehydrogenase (short-subunit alcohol dehydrogenase family)